MKRNERGMTDILHPQPGLLQILLKIKIKKTKRN